MSLTRNLNLGSSPARLKKRRLFFVRFYIILFLLLIIILTLAILSGHEKVKINNIIISGNAAVSTEKILEIVNLDLLKSIRIF